MNAELAQATVCQSRFSLDAHRRLGIALADPVVIPNAPDPAIFHPPDGREPLGGRPRAGRRRELVRQPAEGHRRPAGARRHGRSEPLRADVRRSHDGGARGLEGRGSARPRSDLADDSSRGMDCYVAASIDDPCSNALLEALACGLPALFRRSGGHPELVGEGGVGFDGPDDAAAALDRLAPSSTSGATRSSFPRSARSLTPTSRCFARERRPARPCAPAAGARRRRPAADARLGAVLAAVRARRRRLVGARRRGRVRHLGRAARRLPARAAGLGAVRSAAGRLPHEPLRRARPQVDGVDAPARPLVLPRPARDARLPGVRPSRTRRSGATPPASSASTSPTGRWRSSCSPRESTRSRVHRIPIGIELDAFPLVDPARREAARRAFDLPADAFVVGSFSEGRAGFGDGLEPKAIKGPDVLVDALERRRATTSPTSSCSSPGPARGYVRQGLADRGIRFTHRMLRRTRRASPGVPRARCVRRRVAPGGRAEEHPRVDGHAACRSSRRGPGRRRPRRGRRERAAGRRRGRRGPRRRAAARPRRRRARREAPRGGSSDGGGDVAPRARAPLGGAPRGLRRARMASAERRATAAPRRGGHGS